MYIYTSLKLEFGTINNLKTKAHGIPRVFGQTHIAIKTVWVFFITISWTACAYFSIRLLLQYLEFQVNVNVELIEESPTLYPVIHICNLSPYNPAVMSKEQLELVNKLDAFNNSMPEYPILNEDFSEKTNIYKFDRNVEMLQIRYVKVKADSLIKKKLTELEHLASLDEIKLTDIGFKMSDMLLSCKFQGKYCSPDDFKVMKISDLFMEL